LAAAEKRALEWLALRIPHWVSSDHLTVLGLLSLLAAGSLFWVSRWHRSVLPLVVVALVLNWFGDSLDGTLARVRNRQRPRYGFYIDHVFDVLGLFFLIGGLSLSGFINPLIAFGLLTAYLMVSAEVFLATCVQGVFRLACFGFGPTEMRILLSIGTLCLMHSPTCRPLGLGPFMLFDLGAIVAIVGLGVAFVASALRNTRQLYRAEPSR
jgi:phosphatidylglycerophosphate synthase